MATQDTILVAFQLGDKFKKIKISPSSGYDRTIELVASRWGLSSIELEYLDPACGDVFVLSCDEELDEVFAQNYKWKVVDKSSSQASLSGSDALQNVETVEDEYDNTVATKKETWTRLISSDWQCKTDVQRHPFFISYRQATESTIAEKLFYQIRLALIEEYRSKTLVAESKLFGQHAFLDKNCISIGVKWGLDFMSGLYHSSVIILLLSNEAMERMKQADKKPDNVLLEWELSLQMNEERGHDIMPVLLCSRVQLPLNGKIHSLIREFDLFDHMQFPDKPHKHPLSPGQFTVREIVQKILEFNGPTVNPEQDVLKIVTDAREIQNRRIADLKSQNPSQDIFLSRFSLAQLEDWLCPLSAQMEMERDSHLKNFVEGTRQWLLGRVLQFLSVEDPMNASPNRVMWLQGVAGVGKSVMAAIVARELQALNLLGGQFFCKYDDEQFSSARNLILTLAFGLAKFSIHFGTILFQVKQENPDILSHSVFDLMNALIVEPLRRLFAAKSLDKPVVLVVDALDECGVLNKRAEILLVFKELNRCLPEHVKILVSGRPEEDIKKAFEHLPTESIEPSAVDNYKDHVIYAKSFLVSHGADEKLAEEGSKILVEKSSGVFVWLVTACKYLKGSENEMITLEQIKELPVGDKLDGSIDAMYTRIFSGLFNSTVHPVTLQRVLAIITLAFEPLSVVGIVSLLVDEDPENVRRSIRMLEPILVLDKFSKKIRIFHKSVKDYLTDPSRCKFSRFQIDPTLCHSEIAKLCLASMEKTLKFNLCGIPFTVFHSDIPSFDAVANRGIPQHVKYGVKHFWEHCRDSAYTSVGTKETVEGSLRASPKKEFRLKPELEHQLQSFLENHSHHYLEASSLLKSLDLVVPAMTALEMLFGHEAVTSLSLLQDIRRIVQKFLIPLQASALQVYFTAIPFAPSESEFFKLFSKKVPSSVQLPSVVKGQRSNWPACISIFEGHSHSVASAVFSPNGLHIVSGGEDRTIRIWNASTGHQLLRIEGHTGFISSTAYSPDGQYIVSGSDDKTIRIWDASTGVEVRKMDGHTAEVNAVGISADGQLIISGSSDKSVRIWEVSTGKELHRLEGHSSPVYCVSFSPDGKMAVSGGQDKVINLWNTVSGLHVMKLEGHTSGVSSAVFSPDGLLVISGSRDQTVSIWDTSNGKRTQKLVGHAALVVSVAVSPDGQLIVSASRDHTVRVWRISSGEELFRLEDHTSGVYCASFSPDNRFIVSGSQDKTIRIWNAGANQEKNKLEGHSSTVFTTSFSPDGQLVVSGGRDKSIRLWDFSTGQEIRKMMGHPSAVYSTIFSPDGRLIASRGADKTARIWSVSTGKELFKLEGHSGDISALAFSPDVKRIVGGSGDGLIRVWDADSGKVVKTIESEPCFPKSLSFSPDGSLFASGGKDGDVKVWSSSTNELLQKIDGPPQSVDSIVFSKDGASILTQSEDAVISVWDVQTGKMLEGQSPTADSQRSSPPEEKIWAKTVSRQTIKSFGGDAGQHDQWQAASAAWIFLGSRACFWLPPETRGNYQLFGRNSVFTLGAGVCSVIQF